MARRELDVKIDAENRDKGKVFRIIEMDAERSEKWAMRALSAMVRSGVEVPADIEKSGMAGIATVGIKAVMGIEWSLAEPLLDELFECVKIQPDPNNPSLIRPLISQDIEEISTRLKLRQATLGLHVDFLGAALQSISDKLNPAKITGGTSK